MTLHFIILCKFRAPRAVNCFDTRNIKKAGSPLIPLCQTIATATIEALVNKKMFGRGVHKGYYLRGLVSVEVCRDGGALDGCLHFHYLFQPNAKLNRTNAERVLFPKVLKILKDLRDWKGRSISNAKLVKVSPFWGMGTLRSTFESCALTASFHISLQGVRQLICWRVSWCDCWEV